MGKYKTVEIYNDIHPNRFEVEIIYPMLNALGRCVSGEYINAAEDWWMDKIQHDITWQRFQILPETQAIRYENQYMVEKYFEYIKMQLPALTGTIFENLDAWHNPPLTFSKWLGQLGLSDINGKDTTTWWRGQRTAAEREDNRHPNRGSTWIPERLRKIKRDNTFYFGKPLTRTVEEWSQQESKTVEVEKIITQSYSRPEDHAKWKQYEYLSPFSYRKSSNSSRTPIWLRNPNTMQYFEDGEEKIDYQATASVFLQNIQPRLANGEWEICVVKIFRDMSQKRFISEDQYEIGETYAAILTFGVEDFNELLTGVEEGVRLYPKSFRIQIAGGNNYVNNRHTISKRFKESQVRPKTFSELKVVNYYAPITNQYGMFNWYGSF